MLSVRVWPKVIPLRGVHCNAIYVLGNEGFIVVGSIGCFCCFLLLKNKIGIGREKRLAQRPSLF
jgi:hypothetical protein